mmetsp:Transcript_47304/g.137751  ORF Transcript_47304/g.137751 Transcript_47304/m.137751 type:complete len:226 (-) Transcript_47304:235-912(-)
MEVEEIAPCHDGPSERVEALLAGVADDLLRQRQCQEAYVGDFKKRRSAQVGGNISRLAEAARRRTVRRPPVNLRKFLTESASQGNVHPVLHMDGEDHHHAVRFRHNPTCLHAPHPYPHHLLDGPTSVGDACGSVAWQHLFRLLVSSKDGAPQVVQPHDERPDQQQHPQRCDRSSILLSQVVVQGEGRGISTERHLAIVVVKVDATDMALIELVLEQCPRTIVPNF